MPIDIDAVMKKYQAQSRYVAEVNRLKATPGANFDAYLNTETGVCRIRVTKTPALPKKRRGTCGAMTRKGAPCMAKVALRPGGKLANRCRLHGGLSTGPRTAEGRAAVSLANTRRRGTTYKPRAKPTETH